MKTKKPRQYTSKLISDLLSGVNTPEYEKVKIRMQLAARLADLISNKGWKKSEFAQKLNKKPSEVTKWLSGTHNFTVDTLIEIAFVFELSVDALFLKPSVVNKYESIMKTVPNSPSVRVITPYVSSFKSYSASCIN